LCIENSGRGRRRGRGRGKRGSGRIERARARESEGIEIRGRDRWPKLERRRESSGEGAEEVTCKRGDYSGKMVSI
jgi:hypothetical protein